MTALKHKLQLALHSLHADVFGIEKRVRKSILNYLNQQAKKVEVPLENIQIRIVQREDFVCVFLHKKILTLMHLQQPTVLVHKDWPMDHGS